MNITRCWYHPVGMTVGKEAHLSMIQGVVSRLGQNSFLLKGWSVLLVSALLAVGAASAEKLILLVALLPVLAFWGLDGYFLWQERLFRALYDHVRGQHEKAADYGLDTGILRDRGPSHKWVAATFSRTLIAFHGAILVTIAIVYVVIAIRW